MLRFGTGLGDHPRRLLLDRQPTDLIRVEAAGNGGARVFGRHRVSDDLRCLSVRVCDDLCCFALSFLSDAIQFCEHRIPLSLDRPNALV